MQGIGCSFLPLGVLSGELVDKGWKEGVFPGVPGIGRTPGKQAELWGGKCGTACSVILLKGSLIGAQ